MGAFDPVKLEQTTKAHFAAVAGVFCHLTQGPVLWRRRTAMPTPLRGSLGILVLTVATLTLQPPRAYAQQPPTYDFDPAVPGVQGPTSPLLATPYTHFFRTSSVNVPLLVPAAELQAALPPGFNALPDPLGRATVTALFSFMVTDAEHAPVAPYHTLVLLAGARNTALDRNEVLVLARFLSTQESVDAQNLTTGGGAWLADFVWESAEKGGELEIRVQIDSEEGLGLSVVATGPSEMNQRITFDPNAFPFRWVKAGVALDSFWVGSIFDQRAVATTPTNIDVSANGGHLKLPGGFSLTVLGPGTPFAFSKGQVVYLDWE
jgi:hypothetical protein